MSITLWESGKDEKPKSSGTSIAPGVVKSHCDTLMQGKVQVRLTGRGIDVWARVMGAGGGNGRGLMFFPQPGDEVLVAFNAEDPRDAYILGGLWSTQKRLPASTPVDTINKRTLSTGIAPSPGLPPLLSHQIELDDLTQTITFKASLGQEINLSPTGIQIQANPTTSISLTAPPAVGPGVIDVTVGATNIRVGPTGVEISSPGKISMKAASIDLNAADVSVRGIKLSLNS